MNVKNVAIYGYGNIAKEVVGAINACDDMKLVGVVRRNPSAPQPPELAGVSVVDDIAKLENVDVAILCAPSRLCPEIAKKLAQLSINTVDSYDIHSSIYDVKMELDAVCKKHNTAAIVSAGWDPGTDSVIRALFHAMAPRGITYTNFGPGMSMGHTVCVKSKAGVRDALSMTMPKGDGIHRRLVYVTLEDGVDFEKICEEIKKDPYFAHDETHIMKVDSIDDVKDVGHGVHLVRKGTSGNKANQNFAFDMRINNPALTAQVLVACARAVVKQQSGCYTLIEIPPIDLIEGDQEKIIRNFV